MAVTRKPSSDVGAAPIPAPASAPASPASPAEPAEGLGLSAATALVVGSIVGVGIFNLPTSLASFGPISLVSMGLTTIGAIALAMLFAALSRRMPVRVAVVIPSLLNSSESEERRTDALCEIEKPLVTGSPAGSRRRVP